MEIVEIKRTALVLDKFEAQKLFHALGYCNHRCNEHPESGIHKTGYDLNFGQYIRQHLETIAKEKPCTISF